MGWEGDSTSVRVKCYFERDPREQGILEYRDENASGAPLSIGLIFRHKKRSRFEMGQNGAIFGHGWPTMTLLPPDHDPMVALP